MWNGVPVQAPSWAAAAAGCARACAAPAAPVCTLASAAPCCAPCTPRAQTALRTSNAAPWINCATPAAPAYPSAGAKPSCTPCSDSRCSHSNCISAGVLAVHVPETAGYAMRRRRSQQHSGCRFASNHQRRSSKEVPPPADIDVKGSVFRPASAVGVSARAAHQGSKSSADGTPALLPLVPSRISSDARMRSLSCGSTSLKLSSGLS